MTISEALEAYATMSSVIFKKKQPQFKDGKFKAKTFENIVQSFVEKKVGFKDAKMRVNGDQECKRYSQSEAPNESFKTQ